MKSKFYKKIFCHHEWERTRIESSWYSGIEWQNGMETWDCRCRKCGKQKLIVYEIDENGCKKEVR